MLLTIERHDSPEARSLLGALLPASIVLHVLVVVALPSESARRAFAPAPVVIEVAAPPPPPTVPPTPSPEPAPTAAPQPLALAPREPPRKSAEPPAPAPTADAPVDFTGTTFSNDGPGVALAVGPASPAPAPPSRPVAAPQRPVPALAGPEFVPSSALGRAPRAPGLDTELERNYPPEARRSGVSGTALLRVQLLPDGRVGKVELVSESHPGFGQACERTVRAGHWEPPLDRTGHPVGTEIKYVCKFEVRS